MDPNALSDEQRDNLLARDAFRDKLAENELPPRAIRVQPYLPNRKQRRAQAAALRKHKGEKK